MVVISYFGYFGWVEEQEIGKLLYSAGMAHSVRNSIMLTEITCDCPHFNGCEKFHQPEQDKLLELLDNYVKTSLGYNDLMDEPTH
jgi:hypothetical protein